MHLSRLIWPDLGKLETRKGNTMETVLIARICWSFGHKSKETAWESVCHDESDGLLSKRDNADVKPYRNKRQELRYAVYIDGMANDGLGY